jgi:galactokinase
MSMLLSWRKAHEMIAAQRGQFLSARTPIHIARAPARLDVMGGIADYSGSLVLECSRGATASCGP